MIIVYCEQKENDGLILIRLNNLFYMSGYANKLKLQKENTERVCLIMVCLGFFLLAVIKKLMEFYNLYLDLVTRSSSFSTEHHFNMTIREFVHKIGIAHHFISQSKIVFVGIFVCTETMSSLPGKRKTESIILRRSHVIIQ